MCITAALEHAAARRSVVRAVRLLLAAFSDAVRGMLQMRPLYVRLSAPLSDPSVLGLVPLRVCGSHLAGNLWHGGRGQQASMHERGPALQQQPGNPFKESLAQGVGPAYWAVREACLLRNEAQ